MQKTATKDRSIIKAIIIVLVLSFFFFMRTLSNVQAHSLGFSIYTINVTMLPVYKTFYAGATSSDILIDDEYSVPRGYLKTWPTPQAFPRMILATNYSEITSTDTSGYYSDVALAKVYNFTGNDYISYDAEDWALTPASEQNNQVTYMQEACNYVHAAGYKFGYTPEIDVPGWGQFASVNWTCVNFVDLQEQFNSGSTAALVNNVTQLLAVSKAKNPNLVVFVQLDMSTGSQATLEADILALSQISGVNGVILQPMCTSSLCSAASLTTLLNYVISFSGAQTTSTSSISTTTVKTTTTIPTTSTTSSTTSVKTTTTIPSTTTSSTIKTTTTIPTTSTTTKTTTSISGGPTTTSTTSISTTSTSSTSSSTTTIPTTVNTTTTIRGRRNTTTTLNTTTTTLNTTTSTSSTIAATTVSTGGASSSGGGGAGSGGGGGGSSIPVVNSSSSCYTITNFAQDNAEALLLNGTEVNVVLNFITPTSAGIAIANKSYTISQGEKQLISSKEYNYTLDLLNIFYLPIENTVSVSLCNNPSATIAANHLLNQTTSISSSSTTSTVAPILINKSISTTATINTTSTTITLSLEDQYIKPISMLREERALKSHQQLISYVLNKLGAIGYLHAAKTG